jgi:peptidyl-prolyl cis-trans isomerase D
MLSVFRQNANSWFMMLLFAIITFVFIFTFGSWGGGDVSGDLPWAARVNGRIITQAQFQAMYSTTFRNMSAFQPGFTLKQAKEMDLKNTVLDRLVGTELLAQEAAERGLFISDEEVVEEIKRRYFRDGEFDPEEYKRIVNGVFQTNEARFEAQVQRDLLGERLENLLRESQQVSPAEIRELYNTRNDRVNLEVLRIDPQFWGDSYTEPSDDDAKAWADSHTVEVKDYYDGHMNRYRRPPTATVSQIVVKVDPDAGEDVKKTAREKIDGAKKRLDGGEDFAKVAKDVSEDNSADKGGVVGQMAKGDMAAALDNAAFSIPEDTVSDVIETPLGLYLLKVSDRKPEEVKELDDVKVEIAKILMRDDVINAKAKAAAEAALEQAKAGTALADIQIDGFSGSLTERNDNRKAPRVEETKYFDRKSRYIPRVGISDELAKEAFALSEDNPLAGKVYDVSKRLFVVKLKERERPDPEKFEASKSAIENELLNARRQQVVDQFVKELKTTAEIVKNQKVLGYGDA